MGGNCIWSHSPAFSCLRENLKIGAMTVFCSSKFGVGQLWFKRMGELVSGAYFLMIGSWLLTV
jgi:hypothetical protein